MPCIATSWKDIRTHSSSRPTSTIERINGLVLDAQESGTLEEVESQQGFDEGKEDADGHHR